MKTFSVYNVVMIAFASFMCVGSLKLGFGSFSDPGAGFMPFLSGMFVILLSLFDLAFSAFTRWKTDKKDTEIWANILWGRLVGNTDYVDSLCSLNANLGIFPPYGDSALSSFFVLLNTAHGGAPLSGQLWLRLFFISGSV